jgi:hypothetical protein
MSIFPLAALCGIVGAIASHCTYVQSNLFILGDVTRRGRHPLWDPVAFDLMGLGWGIVVGIVVAKLLGAHSGKELAAGLGATVLGIVIVGAAATVSRYQELYSHPNIQGPALVLEFELRLPADRDPAGELPDVVELAEGAKSGSRFAMDRGAIRVSEGRIILPGRVSMKNAVSDRLISFPKNENWHAIFALLMAEMPVARDFEWSEWQPENNPRPGLSDREQFQIRYRVQAVAETKGPAMVQK